MTNTTDLNQDTAEFYPNPSGLKLAVAGRSDRGQTRPENQDHFLIADLNRQLTVRQTDVNHGSPSQLFGCLEGHLLVVADGMGGHRGGEIASRVAVESSIRYVLDMMQWFLKLRTETEDDFLEELALSLEVMQDRIWQHRSSGSPEMGTTVTMAYIVPPTMYIVHAGDSRCYLLRNNELKQLTTDHTLAQQMIDSGDISKDDPSLQRWHHVLWNCVGGGDGTIQPEVLRVRLEQNDRILLCSDGLSNMVDDQVILEECGNESAEQEVVDRLIQLANEAGGKDNITAILAKIEKEF